LSFSSQNTGISFFPFLSPVFLAAIAAQNLCASNWFFRIKSLQSIGDYGKINYPALTCRAKKVRKILIERL